MPMPDSLPPAIVIPFCIHLASGEMSVGRNGAKTKETFYIILRRKKLSTQNSSVVE
jgi:hypothetical protein